MPVLVLSGLLMEVMSGLYCGVVIKTFQGFILKLVAVSSYYWPSTSFRFVPSYGINIHFKADAYHGMAVDKDLL